MIVLTKMNDEEICLNERYIESIEATPDTTIRIHDGTVFVVQESPTEIMQRIREWQTSSCPHRADEQNRFVTVTRPETPVTDGSNA